MSRFFFISTIAFLLLFSCKSKQSQKHVVNPKTAIYVDDSAAYYELINLNNDIMVNSESYTKKDLPEAVIAYIANHIHVENNKVADVNEVNCSCNFYNPGIKYIYLNKNKEKGFVTICQGTYSSIETTIYFNSSIINIQEFLKLMENMKWIAYKVSFKKETL